MSLSRTLSFPDTQISEDAEQANYRNYLAWQAQHEARRRESITQFNMFQNRSRRRMCSQVLYKEEAEQQSESLKDMIERRLSNACECDECDQKSKERSNSVSSLTPSSPTSSVRSSSSSLVPGPGPSLPTSTGAGTNRGPSGRNTLIMSPPPRSRHHKRRAQTTKS